MVDDAPSNDTNPTDLPEPVHQWLTAIADDQDVSQETLLAALLTQLNPDEAQPPGTLEEFRDEFQALVEDVRRRVIQVKRETDEKAHQDHSHSKITDRVNDLATTIAELDDEITTLNTALDDGFDNYENILEYLTDTTDALSTKLTTLANTVIDLQDQFDTLTEHHAEHAILTHLTTKANRNGVTRAKCDACNNRVYLALLNTPRCPHCAERLRDIDINRRFFGTHTLETGSLPALDGDTTTDSIDLSQRTAQPDFDPNTILSRDATDDDTPDQPQEPNPPDPDHDTTSPSTDSPQETDRS